MQTDSDIWLSVSFITYNHERYVEQALRSAVMQKADFLYEVVVGEDCSTDRTRAIVQGIASEYPKLVRILPRFRNLGAFQNARETAESCRGKYRAVLEGDDYWIDPYKLQKQVAYLEKHPEHVLCFTDAIEVHEDSRRPATVLRPPRQQIDYGLEDILETNFVPTCTVVSRSGLPVRYPDWYTQLRQCDWSDLVLRAEFGRFGYLPGATAVRRVHALGLWSGMSKEEELLNLLSSYRCFDGYLAGKQRGQLKQLIAAVVFKMAVEYRRQGRRWDSLCLLRQVLASVPSNPYVPKFEFIKLLAKYVVPTAVICKMRSTT